MLHLKGEGKLFYKKKIGKKKKKFTARARGRAARARAAAMKRQRLLQSSLHAHHDSAKGSL